MRAHLHQVCPDTFGGLHLPFHDLLLVKHGGGVRRQIGIRQAASDISDRSADVGFAQAEQPHHCRREVRDAQTPIQKDRCYLRCVQETGSVLVQFGKPLVLGGHHRFCPIGVQIPFGHRSSEIRKWPAGTMPVTGR